MRTWRTFRVPCAVAILLTALAAEPAPAQSLGDIAQQEEARRKSAQTGRLYTNEELRPVAPPSAQPAPARPQTSPNAGTAAEAATEADASTSTPAEPPRNKPDEKYWRELMAGLRANVAKAKADLAAQKASLAKLQDDDRPAASREREVITRTITRLQSVAQMHSEELARNLTQAELEGVPAAWLR